MDDRHSPGGSSGWGDLGTSVRRVGDSLVITLAGEIDLLTAPAAHAALDDALSRRDSGGDVNVLVLDLTEVTLLSSKGLQLLITVDRAVSDRGVALRVATGSHRAVLRPLRIAGLDDSLATYRTLEEALSGHPRRTTGSRPTR